MALLDLVGLNSRPEVAYLFPELDPVKHQRLTVTGSGTDLMRDSTFVFQFWPQQIQDSYEVEYATKLIPGGSHPLYQYVGGAGRTIAFEAVFTSEIDDVIFGGTTAGLAALTPSSRYTVNVAGAIAALRSYQYPTYRNDAKKGVADPPSKLRLVLPGTKIGGTTDDILCFLKQARVTIESCFPSGTIRVATVALEFVETVQHTSTVDDEGATIKFISASSFNSMASQYKYRGP